MVVDRGGLSLVVDPFTERERERERRPASKGRLFHTPVLQCRAVVLFLVCHGERSRAEQWKDRRNEGTKEEKKERKFGFKAAGKLSPNAAFFFLPACLSWLDAAGSFGFFSVGPPVSLLSHVSMSYATYESSGPNPLNLTRVPPWKNNRSTWHDLLCFALLCSFSLRASEPTEEPRTDSMAAEFGLVSEWVSEWVCEERGSLTAFSTLLHLFSLSFSFSRCKLTTSSTSRKKEKWKDGWTVKRNTYVAWVLLPSIAYLILHSIVVLYPCNNCMHPVYRYRQALDWCKCM